MPCYLNKNTVATLLILFLSATLLLIAIPRVRAAFKHIGIEQSLIALDAHKPFDVTKISVLAERMQSTVTLVDDPRYWQNLGELFFYQAEKDDFNSYQGRIYLKTASLAMQQSLLRSPANSLLWFKLARVNVLLQETNDTIKRTLMMSIITGPHEVGFLIPRLHLSLLLFSSLTSEELELLSHQIIVAWTLSPIKFVQLIAQDKTSMDNIRSLLQPQHSLILNEIVDTLEKTH